MDVFFPIVIFVIACIVLSVCGWCCKRKREGTVYGPGTAVTITTTTQPISASPVVVPPYPVEPRHPTPHQGAPVAGFSNPPYPTHNPYPVASVPMYYPPPMGGGPYPPMSVPAHQTPYPPAGPPYPDYGNQPPSYSEAVGQPSVPPPPTREVYAKQAPYNPNY